MKHLILLTVAIAAGAALADDGKDYRICGMEGKALRLVESRPRTIRPVVALPVEEAPLEVRTLTMDGELDDFDCEALGRFVGTVRIDAGDAGVAKEAYFHGLPLRKFLDRERAFRPPVAHNGFGSWDDAECLAGPIASNRCARVHRGFMDVLGNVVMEELYRPIVELEDPKCICPSALAEAISNDVVKNVLYEQSLIGAIDVFRARVAISRSMKGKIETPKSNLVRMYKALEKWNYPAHRGEAEQRVYALMREIDAGSGDPFTQILLAQALLNFHVKPRSNVVPPADATNLIRRITALAERYAQSPERTRFCFEQVRNIVSRPADTGTHSFGFSMEDRRHLVACLRSSKADPWLADVFEGMIELDLAWYGKGDMYDYCPKESWPKLVYPHLIAARELFYRAWCRHAELPEGAFGMLVVEWEFHHSANAARWLGQLWDAELDTPWMHALIRNRLLPWFPREKKLYGKVRNQIAVRKKREAEYVDRKPAKGSVSVAYTASYLGDPAPLCMSLTAGWKDGSFRGLGSEAGVAPYADAGKLLKMELDPMRRERLWPEYWRDCMLPVDHEGEIEVEFVSQKDAFAFVAFGVLYAQTMEGLFAQVTRKNGTMLFEGYRTCFGEPEVYPHVFADKAVISSFAPETSRFRLRYRVNYRTVCVWLDGNLILPLVSLDPRVKKQHFHPALFGSGVKIHAVRYRKVPDNAGFEEFVE